MKDKIRILNVISKMIDLDLFYNIDISGTGIRLQGRFKTDIIRWAANNKFLTKKISDNYFVEFMRNGSISITIILTD